MMSYGPTELAQHKILGRFAENKELIKRLSEYKEPTYPEDDRASGIKVDRENWRPRYVVAIDGSHKEIQYDQGFPGAELGYISIATVLIDVHQLLSEAEKTTIDPVEFNKVQSAYPFTSVLASANMVNKDMPDARSTFRQEWYELLQNTRPANEAETLLDTYEALLQHKAEETEQKCPLLDACANESRPGADYATGKCACGKYPVYLSDALRIHEGFGDFASNGECFGEVMRVLEHLFLVGFLRYMERICKSSENWTMFEDTAIVMDGSLAVFGHPAWLSQAIKSELKRLNNVVRSKTGKDILVFGIEKTGRFFDHWCRLDQKSKADYEKEKQGPLNDVSSDADFQKYTPGRITKQSVLLVDDPYIKKYIVPSSTDKAHGKDTYYGRPFFYKTTTGAMIIGISAILSNENDDRSKADLSQFPRLADTLDLLDLLVSMRHPNAVIPLIAAHAEAAIPLKMGEKVFDKLARDYVGKFGKANG